ncbi:hypothetical protein JK636_13315 [Clostridium sp. YIM B02515]|uniref:DUF4363 family protein n=1 Tax=Clostridium rhizosphaerae TaxID=2803861 RepID=A0ABS1TBJ8_9CLOT|nr:hypothetical protein [Clostridium rhizosphaerae]MBL4936737.1 hypothetical protein [Clostridium rhizosphaerae]
MKSSSKSILGWIVILYLSITLILFIVWFFPWNSKQEYKNYKHYESSINKKLQATIDSVDKFDIIYQEKKISKRQLISKLKRASYELEKLHDSFKWRKGDDVTKELYLLKKEIIISYAQIYKNRAQALSNGIIINEQADTNFIQIIIDRYNHKDKLERERYNLAFLQ